MISTYRGRARLPRPGRTPPRRSSRFPEGIFGNRYKTLIRKEKLLQQTYRKLAIVCHLRTRESRNRLLTHGNVSNLITLLRVGPYLGFIIRGIILFFISVEQLSKLTQNFR